MEPEPEVYGSTIPLEDGKSMWVGFHKVLFNKTKLEKSIITLKNILPEKFKESKESKETKKEKEKDVGDIDSDKNIDEPDKEIGEYDYEVLTFIFMKLVSKFTEMKCLIDIPEMFAEKKSDNKTHVNFLGCSGFPLHSLGVVPKSVFTSNIPESSYFYTMNSDTDKDNKKHIPVAYHIAGTVGKSNLFNTTSFLFQKEDKKSMITSLLTLAIHYASVFSKLGIDPVDTCGLEVSLIQLDKTPERFNDLVCLSVMWFYINAEKESDFKVLSEKQIAICQLMQFKEALVIDDKWKKKAGTR